MAALSVAAPAGVEIPANWRDLISQEIQVQLKDPYSAMVVMTRGPRYGDHKLDLQMRPGWAVCYSINAKNSYGGYTGAKTYAFVVSPFGSATMISTADFRSNYAAAVVREKVLEECARPADPPTAPEPKAEI